MLLALYTFVAPPPAPNGDFEVERPVSVPIEVADENVPFDEDARGDTQRVRPGDLSLKLGKWVTLRPGGMITTRFTLNVRETPPEGKSIVETFTLPRARLLLGADVTDYISLFFRIGSLNGAPLEFERAFVDLKFGKAVRIRAGQFYLPPLAEMNVGANKTLATDYSPTAFAFEPGATRGAMLMLQPTGWRISAAVSDGLRSGFSEILSPARADVGVTGYVEHIVFDDDWTRFGDFTSFPGSSLIFKMGTGAHWQTGGKTSNTADIDVLYVAQDLHLEGNGWGAFGQLVYSRLEVGDEPGPQVEAAGRTYHDWGLVLQAAGFIVDWVEVFGRWDQLFADGQIHPDDLGGTGQTDFRTLTGGFNVYVFPGSHMVRFQTDVMYMFDPQATSLAPTFFNSGILPTEQGAQWTMRTQITASF